MSDFSLTLVLQIKTSKTINDMAKVQLKSEKITTFGGKNSAILYERRRDVLYFKNLYYQRATRPIEPKSKAAVLTPKALNALTMVEKVMLLPLSIFDI